MTTTTTTTTTEAKAETTEAMVPFTEAEAKAIAKAIGRTTKAEWSLATVLGAAAIRRGIETGSAYLPREFTTEATVLTNGLKSASDIGNATRVGVALLTEAGTKAEAEALGASVFGSLSVAYRLASALHRGTTTMGRLSAEATKAGRPFTKAEASDKASKLGRRVKTTKAEAKADTEAKATKAAATKATEAKAKAKANKTTEAKAEATEAIATMVGTMSAADIIATVEAMADRLASVRVGRRQAGQLSNAVAALAEAAAEAMTTEAGRRQSA